MVSIRSTDSGFRNLSKGESARGLLKKEDLGLSALLISPRRKGNQVSPTMSADKTSSFQSSDLEREPLAKEAMDEIKEINLSDIKQDRTRSQYDLAYCKRAMRTGCMILVFMSVVSLFSEINHELQDFLRSKYLFLWCKAICFKHFVI